MTNPPSPAAVKVILEAERARIISLIDARIASWVQFQADYPENEHDVDLAIAELDYIRSVVYDSKHPNRR